MISAALLTVQDVQWWRLMPQQRHWSPAQTMHMHHSRSTSLFTFASSRRSSASLVCRCLAWSVCFDCHPLMSSSLQRKPILIHLPAICPFHPTRALVGICDCFLPVLMFSVGFMYRIVLKIGLNTN